MNSVNSMDSGNGGVVRAHAEADLLSTEGWSWPVSVSLAWRPDDPYAIDMVLRLAQTDPGDPDSPPALGGPDGVLWALSRELLTEGLTCSAGQGDVRVRPHHDSFEVTLIELHGTNTTWLLEFDTADLAEFLSDTYDQVPDGAEDLVIDLDSEIEWLLASEW